MNRLVQSCIAEFVGTFVFVFLAIASVVVAQSAAGWGGTLVTIALAQGLALGLMITATMYISGGQLNPAVSVAMAFLGKQTWERAGWFVGSQLLAAVCATGLMQVLAPTLAGTVNVSLGATAGGLTTGGEWWAVLGFEMVATFTLMTAVLMCTVDERAPKFGGFVVGMALAACVMAFGPLTGASLNPARSFGPALVGWNWTMHWAYWVAPIFGALGAAQLYKSVWCRKAEGRGAFFFSNEERTRKAA